MDRQHARNLPPATRFAASPRLGPSCILVLLLSCLWAQGSEALARPATKQEIAVLALRHYALSSCLRQGLPAIADEADAAKDAYLQNGIHPAETYQAIQPMAAEWLRRSYPSFRNADLTILKCIDFADSREVGSLARRTMPRWS